MKPFSFAFQHATPHGVLSAFHLPDTPEPVAEEILSQLDTQEAEFALSTKGFRQIQFVGGRLAARHAANQLRMRLPALLPDERGTPSAPDNLRVSISHKGNLAIALVSPPGPFHLGVDLETYGPPRPNIIPKVLTAKELEEIEQLSDPQRRWLSTLIRFSIKECIYKAIDPYVRRYVGFDEASVHPDLDGTAAVNLHLQGEDGSFWANARYFWLRGWLLTSVRIGRNKEIQVESSDAGG